MKIEPKDFYDCLKKNDIGFFTGVPDSLLKDICAFIDEHGQAQEHMIAANEGNAVAIASGYYLRTGRVPLVYMQNSGLGNAVNPLLSLCDPEIYSIPLLLLIGWRGEPGVKDAIQHVKDGRIQEGLLKTLELPFETIGTGDDYVEKIDRIVQKAVKESRPVALVVKKGTFAEYKAKQRIRNPQWLAREEALEAVLSELRDKDTVFLSTTGKTSRELYEIREKAGDSHKTDFLNVGAMGHCSSIALGSALADGAKRIICIDGDGALIMHMGALAVIGSQKPRSFIHVVINNGAHESVGGQPTAGFEIDICAVAKACGYTAAVKAHTLNGIKGELAQLKTARGPVMLEITVNVGSREDLGRPKTDLREFKKEFMEVG